MVPALFVRLEWGRAALVFDEALMVVRPDDERLVVRLRQAPLHLQLKIAEEVGPDRLDLHIGEIFADAAMSPAPEAKPPVGEFALLLPRGQEPVRVVFIGIGEDWARAPCKKAKRTPEGRSGRQKNTNCFSHSEKSARPMNSEGVLARVHATRSGEFGRAIHLTHTTTLE